MQTAERQDRAALLDRRGFLAAGAGLTLGLALPGAVPGAGEATAATTTQAVNSWLSIGTDGSVSLAIGASDMGQGAFAGLAQVLAEDLMVDYRRVRLVQGGPTLVVPAPIGSALPTVGSSVTRSNYWRLRDAGAAAREMLVSATMARVGDPTRSNYSVTNGVITHIPSGVRTGYGAVAADAARLPVPTNAPLVPDDQLRSIGKRLPRLDIPAKVDGSTVYGIDVRVPGMVYAVIRHCPSFGGRLAATPAVPSGMIAVVPVQVLPGFGRGAEAVGNVNAVAVVGPDTWTTMKASRRLSLKWTLPPDVALIDSNQFIADAQRLMTQATPYVPGGANPPGTVYTVERSTADAATALAASAKTIDRTYTLPYQAHVCMEVLNCTVDYVPGERCTIWAPTQMARSVLAQAVAMTGLAADKVQVHTTNLGGGLGRKAEMDFICQALQVAMAIRRPVKLMWPREEDFTHDQYRPMAMVRVRAGLDANRLITGWTYRNVSPSILAQRGVVLGPQGDSQGWEASQGLPYAFGARLTEYVSHPSPVPVGFWRSVGASINTFAVESAIDELAAAAGQDAWRFRRARLTDPRWIAVLDAAANAAGWSTAPPAGRARGIAIGHAFNSIVAQVVEVARAGDGSVRVEKVTVAIDCYLVVNPASVEAQLMGGVIHAMNATLYGRQTFSGGAAQHRNFNTHRMVRLGEAPTVKVVIMPAPAVSDRTVPIGGVGELGVPTFAPALAGAWAKLTGQRVRTLPFYPAAGMGDG